MAAEASEAHLDPERDGHVARGHERRRRRHEQRRHHGHHEPCGPHPAPHPLRPPLPRRRHLPPLRTGAVSVARNSRRAGPANSGDRRRPRLGYEPPPRMRRGQPPREWGGFRVPCAVRASGTAGAEQRGGPREGGAHCEQWKRRRGDEKKRGRGGTGGGGEGTYGTVF